MTSELLIFLNPPPPKRLNLYMFRFKNMLICYMLSGECVHSTPLPPPCTPQSIIGYCQKLKSSVKTSQIGIGLSDIWGNIIQKYIFSLHFHFSATKIFCSQKSNLIKLTISDLIRLRLYSGLSTICWIKLIPSFQQSVLVPVLPSVPCRGQPAHVRRHSVTRR